MMKTEKNWFDIPESVNYIIVELISKKEVEQKIAIPSREIEFKKGLFLGIKLFKDQIFMVITNNGRDEALYNINCYYISSVEFKSGDTKKIWFGRHEESDQHEGFGLLWGLIDKFKEHNKLDGDDELIDINKMYGYEVEDFLLDDKCRSRNKNTKPLWNDGDYEDSMLEMGYPCYNQTGGYHNQNSNGKYNNTHNNVYGTVNPEPVFFKRKTKTNKKKLTLMKESVMSIMSNGGFKKEEKEKEEEKEEKSENYTAGAQYDPDADQDSFMNAMVSNQQLPI